MKYFGQSDYIQRPGFIEKSHAFQRPGFIEGYLFSTKQEQSPLGWGTVMKNIKKSGDVEFFKKHAQRFYQKEKNFFGQQNMPGSTGSSVPAGRAGPNKAGGLVTKYSPDFMFNSDDPCTLYNIPFMMGTGGKIPNDYQAGAIATWIWKGQGPCPWPGTGPNPWATPKVNSDGTLDCGPNKPADTSDSFYTCCPSGWTITKYGDTNPCRGQTPLPGQVSSTPVSAAPILTAQQILAPGAAVAPPDASAGLPAAGLPSDASMAQPSAPLIDTKMIAIFGAVAVLLVLLVLIKR